MRRIAWLVVLSISGAGCRVCDNACRTLVTEPSEYCEDADRREAYARSRQLAEFAWCERFWACPEAQFSRDYADGFIHGFTEHIFAGGAALPPPLPLPPRRYWNDEYATPGGQQAASDWLAGAYDGIKSAQESGYREWMTVPASAPAFVGSLPRVITAPPGIPIAPAPAGAGGPVVPPAPAAIENGPAVEHDKTRQPANNEPGQGSAESEWRLEDFEPPLVVPTRRVTAPAPSGPVARELGKTRPTGPPVSDGPTPTASAPTSTAKPAAGDKPAAAGPAMPKTLQGKN